MRASVPSIAPGDLHKQLAAADGKTPRLVDVRLPQEHALVALPNAMLIPLHELPSRYQEIPNDGRDVVVYCHRGVRSLQGAAFLISKGYPARSLEGGIDLYAQAIDSKLRR